MLPSGIMWFDAISILVII